MDGVLTGQAWGERNAFVTCLLIYIIRIQYSAPQELEKILRATAKLPYDIALAPTGILPVSPISFEWFACLCS